MLVGGEMCEDLLLRCTDERLHVLQLSGCGCLRPPATPQNDDKTPVFALSREEEGDEEAGEKQHLTKV